MSADAMLIMPRLMFAANTSDEGSAPVIDGGAGLGLMTGPGVRSADAMLIMPRLMFAANTAGEGSALVLGLGAGTTTGGSGPLDGGGGGGVAGRIFDKKSLIIDFTVPISSSSFWILSRAF